VPGACAALASHSAEVGRRARRLPTIARGRRVSLKGWRDLRVQNGLLDDGRRTRGAGSSPRRPEAEMAKIMRMPKYRDKFATRRPPPIGSTPQKLAAFIR